jgi:predicted RNA binding protein YcfA (HicA-like mRNA interferase family)
MKQVELVKIISAHGAVLLRHGGNHDIYVNPKTNMQEPVPRHSDIPDGLARKIIKNLSRK